MSRQTCHFHQHGFARIDQVLKRHPARRVALGGTSRHKRNMDEAREARAALDMGRLDRPPA